MMLRPKRGDSAAAAKQSADRSSRRVRNQRVLVSVLVVLGAVCLSVSTVSVWARDAALDPDNWAAESDQLLESPNVRAVLSAYVVDEAFASTDVRAQLQASLPPQLKPLAAPIAGSLRQFAQRATNQALLRPRVQALWRSANRAANERLLAFIEGDTPRLTATGGDVVLNLDAVVADVANQLGLSGGLTQDLQARVQPIVIASSDQLNTTQQVVKTIKAFSIWPLLVGLLFWGGAVYLAHGRRREAVRAAALSLLVIGVLLLVVVRIGGNAVVDNLVRAESVRPAAADVWSVFTAFLAESAAAGVAVGIVGLMATWLAGPTRQAVALRKRLAPSFRDHELVPHAILAGVILLLLLWSPIGTPRRVVSLLILSILAFIGLELLRRQTVREFPDARHGDGLALRERFARSRREAPPESASDSEDDRLDRLERLASLHERGALSDDEYEHEKTLVAAR
jgi:hypothetical protein